MEQNADLVKTLEQIGLSEKEAKVYLALLSLESSTAYEIAQHCEVKKPTVYVILEDLRQKGLVLKVPHAKKALFAAREIGEYLAEQRGKLNSVESLIPRLMSLGGSGKPNVYFFNGLRGFTEAMEYKLETMRGKMFHSFYGNSEDADESVRALYRKWTPDSVSKGVAFKIIMPQGEDDKYYPALKKLRDEKDGIEIKYLSEYSQASNLSIEIAETFLRIDDAKHVTSTIIDDKATADAFRSIFKIVWDKGV